jgi:hypothetical protein
MTTLPLPKLGYKQTFSLSFHSLGGAVLQPSTLPVNSIEEMGDIYLLA